MSSFEKWTPAVIIVPKDRIVSSDFAKAEPFVPAYTKEPEDMQLILSNSYAKKWFQEKTVHKKKFLEYKNDNEVFLMRRYVVRGLAKKMKELELRRRAPSRVKIGKRVPFAVRLLPPGDNDPKPTASKSSVQTPKSKPATPSKMAATSSQQREEDAEVERNSVKKAASDLEELNRKLHEFAQTETHLHAERVGRKLKIHRVKCAENHYHGCECEI